MKTGTKSLIFILLESAHTHTTSQHKWVKPNPSVTVCLANSQRAKLLVEYSSTRRKKERKSGERRERNTGQNGRRDGRKRRRASNARRNGKTDGQTGTLGEQRLTKRENGTRGAELRADGARRNGKTVQTRRKRRVGSARRDGKPG